MNSSDSPELQVFVSADASTNTAIARRLLSGAPISVVTWDEVSAVDSALGLQGVLDKANALVALVDQRTPSAGVLLEIGAALGRGLPVILLLTEADLITALPSPLRELPAVVTTEAEDAVAQRLSDSIRSAVEASSFSRAPKPAKSSLGYVKEIEGRRWADESERQVATALASLGARVVGQEPANDRGQVDLAAWIPALPVPHLNPILIEVAGRRPNVRAKERQLHRFLQDRDAQIGMLVLPDDETLRWNVREGRAIVILSLHRLASLTPDSLVRLIMDGRNRLSHAAS